jgi:hypothetical protein
VVVLAARDTAAAEARKNGFNFISPSTAAG